MKFAPLRLDFRFRGLMAEADHLIHLDGILSAAALEQALTDHPNPNRTVSEAALDLPLDRYKPKGAPDSWVFKASALVLDRTGQTHLRFRTRRYEGDEYADALATGRIRSRKNIIPQGSGPMRAVLLWDSVEVVWSARAWCIGNQDEIEKLLAWVTGLGALRKNGFGELVEVTVTRDEAAFEKWRYRQMPEPVPGYAPMQVQLTPPYWRRASRVMGYVPTTPIG